MERTRGLCLGFEACVFAPVTLEYLCPESSRLRYDILVCGKRPPKAARSNSVHVLKSIRPFQGQPRNSELYGVLGLSETAILAVDFYRKQRGLNQEVMLKG